MEMWCQLGIWRVWRVWNTSTFGWFGHIQGISWDIYEGLAGLCGRCMEMLHHFLAFGPKVSLLERQLIVSKVGSILLCKRVIVGHLDQHRSYLSIYLYLSIYIYLFISIYLNLSIYIYLLYSTVVDTSWPIYDLMGKPTSDWGGHHSVGCNGHTRTAQTRHHEVSQVHPSHMFLLFPEKLLHPDKSRNKVVAYLQHGRDLR